MLVSIAVIYIYVCVCFGRGGNIRMCFCGDIRKQDLLGPFYEGPIWGSLYLGPLRICLGPIYLFGDPLGAHFI